LMVFSCAAFLVLAVAAAGHCQPAPQPRYKEINQKIPDLTLRNIEGGETSLRSFPGKVVLIDFWGTWCVPCLEEVHDLVKLQEKYKDQGLQIIGITIRDKPHKVEDAVKMLRINYVVLLGHDAARYAFGGVSVVPTMFIAGRDGVMRYRFNGQQKIEDIESKIVELLKQPEEACEQKEEATQ